MTHVVLLYATIFKFNEPYIKWGRKLEHGFIYLKDVVFALFRFHLLLETREYFWGILLKPMCFHVRWPQHWNGRVFHFKLLRKVFVEALLCTGPSSLKQKILQTWHCYSFSGLVGWNTLLGIRVQSRPTLCTPTPIREAFDSVGQVPRVLKYNCRKCENYCLYSWNLAPKPHSRVQWHHHHHHHHHHHFAGGGTNFATQAASVLWLFLRLPFLFFLFFLFFLVFFFSFFLFCSLAGFHLECTSNSLGATSLWPAGLPKAVK